MSQKLIIWDWNGTLLNDVDYAVLTINKVLKKYNLPQVSVELYKDLFCFPVKEYYRKIGFDFSVNSFEKIGKEFIDLYNQNLSICSLFPEALSTFKELKNNNIKQIVISARYNDALLTDLDNYGISEYFDEILGINDNYASSKEYLFEKYFEKNSFFDKKDVTLVGDTIHDCEIAENMKINFLHNNKGHQSKKHFLKCQNLQDISCLSDVLKKIL